MIRWGLKKRPALKTGARPCPCCLTAPGTPKSRLALGPRPPSPAREKECAFLRISGRPDMRGRGAPKGASDGLPPGGGARPSSRDASPSGAPRGGDFCPRGRASGGRFTIAPSEGPRTTPAGFRPPSPAPVQPLKAEPRSGPGRLPAASRVRGYEPRPQAPHPAPRSASVCRTPLARDKAGMKVYRPRRKVKGAVEAGQSELFIPAINTT